MKSHRKNSSDDPIDKNTTVQTARGRLKGALKDLVEPDDEESAADEEITEKKSFTAIPARGRPPKRRIENLDGQNSIQHQSYIMKLFDRSVDLAKYNENSPLYPICRDWMINQPRNKGFLKQENSMHREKRDNIAELLKNGDIKEITSMPSSKDIEITRIPSPLDFQKINEINEINLDYDIDNPLKDLDEIMCEHRNRWIQVKKKWMQQSKVCDEKFASSIELLNNIYKQ